MYSRGWHRVAMACLGILVGACSAASPGPVTTTMSADEQYARAKCQDMIADDVRRQAGEMVIEHCVILRMREIRAGFR